MAREQASKTVRQAASEQEKPKKRRLRVPVRTKKAGKVSRMRRLGRIVVPKYFRESWRELKEVSWPDRRQTVKLTFAVVVFATVFCVAIAIVDYGLDKLFRQDMLK